MTDLNENIRQGMKKSIGNVNERVDVGRMTERLHPDLMTQRMVTSRAHFAKVDERVNVKEVNRGLKLDE